MLTANERIFLLFNPAIEILPFSVKYTCAFSVIATHCVSFNPVNLSSSSVSSHRHSRVCTHENIPI